VLDKRAMVLVLSGLGLNRKGVELKIGKRSSDSCLEAELVRQEIGDGEGYIKRWGIVCSKR
jgi:hypothetical protein